MKRSIVWMAAALATLAGTATPADAADPRYYPAPANAFQLRMGYHAPSDGGTFWQDVEDRFTLQASDFNGLAWGASFIGGLSPYVEFGVTADWYEETVTAGERYYIDTDGFPILHDTTLSQFPLGVDLRFIPGGRKVGKPVFFLGAGAGLNFWEYHEIGDFVDEGDPALPVYFGDFHASGETLEGRVLAGLEIPVSPAFNLSFEGRYSFGESDLEDDFEGFGTIEPGGMFFFVGGSFRF
jgi:hypothetical protein